MKNSILEYINVNNFTHTSEIAKIFNISSYQARHYLLQLLKEGKIERTPQRRGAKTGWRRR
ncbi:hypothetical protein EW399_20585 [Salmonella enterica subsp. enterica serovar Leoben]|uniref:FaeA/PapI family transcriptional regulator n=1 Tax=Salmonella enterica TaxID=28901 RepID=UPI0009B03E50|nr:FaeA/PapI family transcriptional regulator [Salmonella enterica]EAC0470082.1 hypothetical protein [Salmonella enterica subsp. enterica serovar Newport]EBU8532294.1 hypothetical protein [Salmonella enterica subsp. enterica serovar Leoben]ECA9146175.1 hypothetical protein [Salmonella enterica subsp. enterica serovar Montevideo]EDQ9772393.1 hypothetical protein [Salmonella enterica subsp. salamae]EBS2390877.1 hypothetical protein [Salmonella enterica subsp. enterica serovar Newport]